MRSTLISLIFSLNLFSANAFAAVGCGDLLEMKMTEGWLTPLDMRFLAVIVKNEGKAPDALKFESLNKPRRVLLERLAQSYTEIQIEHPDGSMRDLVEAPITLEKDDLIVAKSVFGGEDHSVLFASGAVIRVHSYDPETYTVTGTLFDDDTITAKKNHRFRLSLSSPGEETAPVRNGPPMVVLHARSSLCSALGAKN